MFTLEAKQRCVGCKMHFHFGHGSSRVYPSESKYFFPSTLKSLCSLLGVQAEASARFGCLEYIKSRRFGSPS